MIRRFKLTIGFFFLSLAIFSITATIIAQSVRRNEEHNLVQGVTEQSNRDAKLIAGVVTTVAINESASESDLVTQASDPELESVAIGNLLSASNIYELTLINADGSFAWSSSEAATFQADEDILQPLRSGIVITELLTNVSFASIGGETIVGDSASTYIPLLDLETGELSQVLAVRRDVSGTLTARVNSSRTSMFTTVFSALGGSFILLLGLVLTGDILIHRSSKRAIAHERVASEEKLLTSQIELENKHLRDLNDERDKFLSMVSHELRTPLAAMLGFTDILRKRQDGVKKETNIKHLDVMRTNGQHLNSLIDDMLEVTKIQSGKFEIDKERFSLLGLLEQIEHSGEVILSKRKQILRIDVAEPGIEINADRKRILQVLLNLIGNSAKYSPEGKMVTLKVDRSGDSLAMAVIDEGEGIPEAECAKLFERFYRRDNEETRSQKGLGLGLSIVQGIVEAHDGNVRVVSKVGHGTQFIVTLPDATSANLNEQPSSSLVVIPARSAKLEGLPSAA